MSKGLEVERIKYDLSNETKLSKILYEIGYAFYKGINGMYLHFEVKDNIVYSIKSNDDTLELFRINEKGKIIKTEPYLKKYFIFPKHSIDVENWENYIF